MVWPFKKKQSIAEQKQSAVGGMAIINPGHAHWSSRNYTSFATEGYKKNVVAYQAINRVADAVASVEFTAWRRNTELSDHPILQLLARPNPFQSGVAWMRQRTGYLMIAGDAYDERVRLSDGRVAEMYSHRPDRIKVIMGSNGFPAAYKFEVAGKPPHLWDTDPITLQSDILHTKLFNPMDDVYGMSPIEAGAFAIDQHNEAMTWMQALLQNSARPSGALVYGDKDSLPMDAENFNRLKAEIEEKYQGAKNAGRPMLLEGGLSWQQMGLSPADMSIIENKYSSARDVCLAFGVPPQLLGIPGDNTYANYAEARLAFWEDTVIPLLERMVNDFNHWMTDSFDGVIIKPDLDKIPAIADKRMTLWTMANASADLTVNERREIKGYPPVDGGDVILVNSGQISLQDAAAPLSDSLPADPANAAAAAYGNPPDEE